MQVIQTENFKKKDEKKQGRNTGYMKRLQKTENGTDGHRLISNFQWV